MKPLAVRFSTLAAAAVCATVLACVPTPTPTSTRSPSTKKSAAPSPKTPPNTSATATPAASGTLKPSTTPTATPTASATATPGASSGGSATILASFDPLKGEFTEGLALDLAGTSAYVSAATGKVLKVALADGTKSEYGSVPAPPAQDAGFVLGMAFDSQENLYVAVAGFKPEYKSGIYKIAKGGGAGVLFAQDAAMAWPNGIAIDADDSLFVSDSTGKIFRVSTTGVTSLWHSTDAFLDPDASSACKTGFNIGANGIAVASKTVYVTNSDRAALVKIDREASGSAGTASFLVAADCTKLRGADGLALAADGTLYVAANAQDAVLKVTPAGVVSTLASGTGFAFPSSVALEPKTNTLYVVSAAFGEKKTPGLLKVNLTGK